MTAEQAQFNVKLAETEDELRAAQRLRYEVFVEELGGDGPLVDHDAGLKETDLIHSLTILFLSIVQTRTPLSVSIGS